MKSIIARTDELDNIKKASAELISQVNAGLKLEQASVAIVYCDADVEVSALGKALHEGLGIDVIGVTTTACVERKSGYQDMGILLSVLTGDDAGIIVGSTGELDEVGFPAQIRAAYESAAAKLTDEVKLIYLCAPYIPTITSDDYLNLMDELSDHAPVFGGVATDHYDLQFQKTFLNGEAYDRGLLFLLFSGNIRPVFAMEHQFSGRTEGKGIITKSTNNQVEKVGERSFVDYITSISPIPDEETVIYHFQSTPFIMEMPDYTPSEQPVVRALCTIDHETGAGGFLSKMPEGSVLSINVLAREDLKGSCENTLDRLIANMRETPDYSFSTVLVSTCNARHLLMGDRKELEAGIISEKFKDFPPELSVMGYYAFGEMCPTSMDADGKAKNRFHNMSFAVCAF